MSGSGTTVLEAMILGRHGIGADIDPLALNLGKVKVSYLDPGDLIEKAESLIERSTYALRHKKDELVKTLNSRFDSNTTKFIDYWFLGETQLELVALIQEIERIPNPDLRRFFKIVFSSIIITKSGGVSLAYDLAHTRPHKLKDKVPRSATEEFQKRLNKNIERISQLAWSTGNADIFCGNAQRLGLSDNSVDLIVTSPPTPLMPSTICEPISFHLYGSVVISLHFQECGVIIWEVNVLVIFRCTICQITPIGLFLA